MPTTQESSMSQPSLDESNAVPVAKGESLLDEVLLSALNNPRDRLLMLKLDRELEIFLKDSRVSRLEFPPMSSYQRLIVHRVAQYFKLHHIVVGNPNQKRSIVLCKTPESKVPTLRFTDLIEQQDEEPKQALKILSRPKLSKSDAKHEKGGASDSSSGDKSTLEEREEAYARARARIFSDPNLASSTGSEPENPTNDAGAVENTTISPSLESQQRVQNQEESVGTGSPSVDATSPKPSQNLHKSKSTSNSPPNENAPREEVPFFHEGPPRDMRFRVATPPEYDGTGWGGYAPVPPYWSTQPVPNMLGPHSPHVPPYSAHPHVAPLPHYPQAPFAGQEGDFYSPGFPNGGSETEQYSNPYPANYFPSNPGWGQYPVPNHQDQLYSPSFQTQPQSQSQSQPGTDGEVSRDAPTNSFPKSPTDPAQSAGYSPYSPGLRNNSRSPPYSLSPQSAYPEQPAAPGGWYDGRTWQGGYHSGPYPAAPASGAPFYPPYPSVGMGMGAPPAGLPATGYPGYPMHLGMNHPGVPYVGHEYERPPPKSTQLFDPKAPNPPPSSIRSSGTGTKPPVSYNGVSPSDLTTQLQQLQVGSQQPYGATRGGGGRPQTQGASNEYTKGQRPLLYNYSQPQMYRGASAPTLSSGVPMHILEVNNLSTEVKPGTVLADGTLDCLAKEGATLKWIEDGRVIAIFKTAAAAKNALACVCSPDFSLSPWIPGGTSSPASDCSTTSPKSETAEVNDVDPL